MPLFTTKPQRRSTLAVTSLPESSEVEGGVSVGATVAPRASSTSASPDARGTAVTIQPMMDERMGGVESGIRGMYPPGPPLPSHTQPVTPSPPLQAPVPSQTLMMPSHSHSLSHAPPVHTSYSDPNVPTLSSYSSTSPTAGYGGPDDSPPSLTQIGRRRSYSLGSVEGQSSSLPPQPEYPGAPSLPPSLPSQPMQQQYIQGPSDVAFPGQSTALPIPGNGNSGSSAGSMQANGGPSTIDPGDTPFIFPEEYHNETQLPSRPMTTTTAMGQHTVVMAPGSMIPPPPILTQGIGLHPQMQLSPYPPPGPPYTLVQNVGEYTHGMPTAMREHPHVPQYLAPLPPNPHPAEHAQGHAFVPPPGPPPQSVSMSQHSPPMPPPSSSSSRASQSQIPLPPPPHLVPAVQSNAQSPVDGALPNDYSHILNQAVSPGMLRNSAGVFAATPISDMSASVPPGKLDLKAGYDPGAGGAYVQAYTHGGEGDMEYSDEGYTTDYSGAYDAYPGDNGRGMGYEPMPVSVYPTTEQNSSSSLQSWAGY